MSPDPVDPTPASDSAAAAKPRPIRPELAALAMTLGTHNEGLKTMLAAAAAPAASFARSGISGIITNNTASIGQSVLAGLAAKNAALASSAVAGLNVKDIAAKLGVGVLDQSKMSDTISKLTSGWARDYGALASASAFDSFAKVMPPVPIRIPEAIPFALPPPPPTADLMRDLFHDMRDQLTSEIRVNTEATNANTSATTEAVQEFKGIRRATLPLWATLTFYGIMIVLGALAVILPLLHQSGQAP
jgi:hypothetical protein